MDLIFPPLCLACGSYLATREKTLHLCHKCGSDIQPIISPLCSLCGMGFNSCTGHDHLCGSCLQAPPSFKIARAAVYYTDVVKDMLHRLKYRNDTTVSPAIQTIISQMDRTAFAAVDLIIPVPLHPNRLRQRGMNQSLLLARLFFPTAPERIVTNQLLRIRDTVPQTSLNGKERRTNMHGAFKVAKPSAIQGKSICLVDDVLTTGTTVTECAGKLVDAGTEDVRILTFARAARG